MGRSHHKTEGEEIGRSITSYRRRRNREELSQVIEGEEMGRSYHKTEGEEIGRSYHKL